MAKSVISRQNRILVLVPNRGDTGTTYAEPKWYRYQDKVVSIPLTRTRLVPVPIQVVLVPLQVVLVPLLPVTLIFGILTLLSQIRTPIVYEP